jgi:hypothetical protein
MNTDTTQETNLDGVDKNSKIELKVIDKLSK